MKLKNLIGIYLIGLSMCSAATAAPIKDVSEVAGTWILESVAPGLDKPRIPENRKWEIHPDGRIVTSGYNRHFHTEDRMEFTFKIVKGLIATDNPGRPGTTIDYALYDKNENTMILRGGIEGFYFFRKQ